MENNSPKQYYRNTVDIPTLFDIIEAGCLWYRVEDVMILEDEDAHAEVPYDAKAFEPVAHE